MILLDTHIWVWWVSNDSHLADAQTQFLRNHETEGWGVSIVSCWEVAKLVEHGRLSLDRPVGRWIEESLAIPHVRLVDLSTRIVVESTQLPKPFHRDPADQLLVATARSAECPLMTMDGKILGYPHVKAMDGKTS